MYCIVFACLQDGQAGPWLRAWPYVANIAFKNLQSYEKSMLKITTRHFAVKMLFNIGSTVCTVKDDAKLKQIRSAMTHQNFKQTGFGLRKVVVCHRRQYMHK